MEKTLKAFQLHCCVMENEPGGCPGASQQVPPEPSSSLFRRGAGTSDSPSCLVRHFTEHSESCLPFSQLTSAIRWQAPDDQTLSRGTVHSFRSCTSVFTELPHHTHTQLKGF